MPRQSARKSARAFLRNHIYVRQNPQILSLLPAFLHPVRVVPGTVLKHLGVNVRSLRRPCRAIISIPTTIRDGRCYPRSATPVQRATSANLEDGGVSLR